MIAIVTNGKDPRRIFRFVCKDCGCVYDATEDECDPIFNHYNIAGMKLMCPMPFCICVNESLNVINKEELEK